MPLLVYIHGFNSSPESFKAVKLGDWLTKNQIEVEYQVPRLSPYPTTALTQLENLVAANQPNQCCLIGSSLGGFFATYLVEKYGCRAVLINPSVRPYESLQAYLGENKNFHTGESYLLTDAHADELRAMDTHRFAKPENYWVLLQTGDETLDFKLAAAKYYRSPCVIQQGGDHSFQDFEQWIPRVLHFFGIQ